MKRLTSTHVVYAVVLLTIIAGAILVGAAGRSFFSTGNISAILTGTSVLGFIAIGQTLVILVGSLDLSVPYVVSLSSLVSAGIMANQAVNILPGVLLALLVAAAIGLVNGLIVSGLKVHGFIATLGVGLIVSGYLATNYKGSSGQAPIEFRLLGATGIGPVPISTLIMLVCAAVVLLMLTRTRLGHHIYAVGGDMAVARMSGIQTRTPIIAAHVICSVMAGLAGLLLAARLGVGSPTIGTQGGYDLLSIAAVVLGGTLLAGGKGSLVGTLGGVLIFAMIDNIMSVMQINPFLKDVVRGIVIVVAVAIYARRKSASRTDRFPSTPRPESKSAARQEVAA
ncbi:ribose transport system permease protein [Arthrobacter pigmenti]|uniref:Ribose transport system permease protein n=1 Tax=Arthrobacter pigmenti TaxID=271432 RepID=A0A846RL08_9MICC|nr:ABC transporter permease [Arthrobacter pigmenti]NJC20954.1 ribose transport system permease protein [Arthrobacter pigmenti]